MSRLTLPQLTAVATAAGFEPRAVRAILKVETGGAGFDAATGKLLIQFEPSWFRRYLPAAVKAALGAAEQVQHLDAARLSAGQRQLLSNWQTTQANGVEGQAREWLAFNAAFALAPKAALLSTSWGLPQMMGFNYAALGYASVDEMVDAFRASEANQLRGMLRFLSSKPALARAVRAREWAVVAYYYNGAAYKQFNYDKRLAAAYAALA